MTDMADPADVSVRTEIPDAEADCELEQAVRGRHAIARKYVHRLRRRHPNATPAELIVMIDRQYATAVSTVSAVIAVGTVAASVAITMIPVVGGVTAGAKAASTEAAKAAGKQVAKTAAQEATKHAAQAATKQAAKNVALGAASNGAKRIAGFLPAGQQQLQFELTAIYALALADLHGLDVDRDQARALVFGLTSDRVSQQQIGRMAVDVAEAAADGEVAVSADPSRWATTLADSLPGGAAQSLVRTMQTGQLDALRDGLPGRQRAAVDYGVKAVSGGIGGFVFGRDVIASARTAFPAAPEAFPAHLDLPAAEQEDEEAEANPALLALEDAARATGGWIADAAGTIGGGVASGASAATSVFRRVDLDGDGIPDEARAVTAVKDARGAVAGAASSVGGRVGGLLKRGRRENESLSDDAADLAERIVALAALRDQGLITETEFSAKRTDPLARL